MPRKANTSVNHTIDSHVDSSDPQYPAGSSMVLLLSCIIENITFGLLPPLEQICQDLETSIRLSVFENIYQDTQGRYQFYPKEKYSVKHTDNSLSLLFGLKLTLQKNLNQNNLPNLPYYNRLLHNTINTFMLAKQLAGTISNCKIKATVILKPLPQPTITSTTLPTADNSKKRKVNQGEEKKTSSNTKNKRPKKNSDDYTGPNSTTTNTLPVNPLPSERQSLTAPNSPSMFRSPSPPSKSSRSPNTESEQQSELAPNPLPLSLSTPCSSSFKPE